jgi:hypothetical protein
MLMTPMKNTYLIETVSASSGFLDGLGSVLDISGNGLGLPFKDLVLQPTNIFRKRKEEHAAAPLVCTGDREALVNDWCRVGSDLREALKKHIPK